MIRTVPRSDTGRIHVTIKSYLGLPPDTNLYVATTAQRYAVVVLRMMNWRQRQKYRRTVRSLLRGAEPANALKTFARSFFSDTDFERVVGTVRYFRRTEPWYARQARNNARAWRRSEDRKALAKVVDTLNSGKPVYTDYPSKAAKVFRRVCVELGYKKVRRKTHQRNHYTSVDAAKSLGITRMWAHKIAKRLGLPRENGIAVWTQEDIERIRHARSAREGRLWLENLARKN